jgi:3-deoxy-D-manno-octulosonic acid (KDO) 8-phosphate synthase
MVHTEQDDLRATVPSIVRIGTFEIGNDRPFVLIAGPCQIESRAHALEVADECAHCPP